MKNVTVATKMNLPWVESPFFNDLLQKKELTPEQREMAIHFNQEGFLLLRQQVSHELIDRTLAEINQQYPARVGEEPSRHQDLWKKYPTVRQIASLPQIFDVLRMLYDREPIPFQTLNSNLVRSNAPIPTRFTSVAHRLALCAVSGSL